MNKSIIKWHIPALIFILLSSLIFAGSLQAGEMHNDISLQQKHKDTTLTGRVLEKVFEDQAIIEDQNYLITSQTHFTLTDRHKQSKRIKIQDVYKINFPCFVDLTYRTYAIYTEVEPYHQRDKVLLSLTIKQGDIPKNRLQHRRSRLK